MRFILVNKISNPNELDAMSLPIYEEVILQLKDISISKSYIHEVSQNGYTMEDTDAFQAMMARKYPQRKRALPEPRKISGRYKYFVTYHKTGEEFEISDHEYQRLSFLLLTEPE